MPSTVASFELAACQSASGTVAPPSNTMRGCAAAAAAAGRARPPRRRVPIVVTGCETAPALCGRPRAARPAEREDLQQRRDAAVRRGRRAADGDGDVLLAARREDRRSARDRPPGVERPEDLAGLEVERAQERRRRRPRNRARSRSTDTPPRSGSGVVNFQTRRPVETSIALIEPWSCQFCSAVAEVAVLRARGTRRRAGTSASSASASASAGSAPTAVSAAALKT